MIVRVILAKPKKNYKAAILYLEKAGDNDALAKHGTILGYSIFIKVISRKRSNVIPLP